ncbi:hypothetical protein DINM_005720 [Dirofilaria immitis]|nr:hypothetical protein [Dirofilaria immitis]
MSFKIGDELIHMIGDFANMNRSPDFKVKTNDNIPKIPKQRTERIHSINLAVGVSDELPPFNDIRRQSTGKILHATTNHPFNQRTLSAPVQMKDDIEKIRKKYEKFSLLTDKNNEIEESDFEVLSEEEPPNSPISTIETNGTESMITHKEALTTDDNDNDNDNTSVNPTILSPLLLHTKIINNMDHRGSLILIDDNDEQP